MTAPLHEYETVVPQTSSPGAAGAGLLAGIALGGAGLALGFDGALPTLVRATAATSGGLLFLALGAAGLRLRQPRGGIAFDGAGQRLGLGLTSTRDTLWLPLDAIDTLATSWREVIRDGEPKRLWTASVVRLEAPPIVLAEDSDPEAARYVARTIGSQCGLPVVEELDLSEVAPPPPAAGSRAETRVWVQRRPAMAWIFGLLGLALLVLGGGLFAGTPQGPVVGLFVAPVMLLLGAIFAAIPVFKRFGVEELERQGDRWTHRYRLGWLRWAERTVRATEPRWRVRLQGLRGACLELVAEDGVLVVGNGATTQSRMSAAELSEIPSRLG